MVRSHAVHAVDAAPHLSSTPHPSRCAACPPCRRAVGPAHRPSRKGVQPVHRWHRVQLGSSWQRWRAWRQGHIHPGLDIHWGPGARDNCPAKQGTAWVLQGAAQARVQSACQVWRRSGCPPSQHSLRQHTVAPFSGLARVARGSASCIPVVQGGAGRRGAMPSPWAATCMPRWPRLPPLPV